MRSDNASRGTGDEGQAAVELALVLPLVALLLLALVQVGLVVRDQILVIHAAREAAREAAVDAGPDVPGRAAAASSTLDSQPPHGRRRRPRRARQSGQDARQLPGADRRPAGRRGPSRHHPGGFCHYECRAVTVRPLAAAGTARNPLLQGRIDHAEW